MREILQVLRFIEKVPDHDRCSHEKNVSLSGDLKTNIIRNTGGIFCYQKMSKMLRVIKIDVSYLYLYNKRAAK